MLKIGVLVSGGGTNLQAIIDRIEDGYIPDCKIVSVVSNKKDAYALERAKRHNIQTTVISKKDYENEELYNEALINHFKSKDTDLIVLAGFMVVLGKNFIKAYQNRIINIHPSLIPSFCGKGFYGLKVHQAALKRGVKITGATVHIVDEGTDTGPILIQKAVCVKDNDTAEILQKRVMEEAEWIIYPEAIKMIVQGQIIIGNGGK